MIWKYGGYMGITVTVNYPNTIEGMKIFQEKQAEAAVEFLRKKLTRRELDEVMQILKKELTNEKLA